MIKELQTAHPPVPAKQEAHFMSSTPQNRVHAAAEIARRSRGYVDAFVDWFLGRGWPSYAFVALLQLKIIWDIWRFRDLTGGDTSGYFTIASHWVESFTVNIVWSPLYTECSRKKPLSSPSVAILGLTNQ